MYLKYLSKGSGTFFMQSVCRISLPWAGGGNRPSKSYSRVFHYYYLRIGSNRATAYTGYPCIYYKQTESVQGPLTLGVPICLTLTDLSM